MNICFKCPIFRGKSILCFAIIVGLFGGAFAFLELKTGKAEANEASLAEATKNDIDGMVIAQQSAVLPLSSPPEPDKSNLEIKMLVTAYSSTVWQTDDTPFITAAGTSVREGIVANNYFPFGTKIKIPKLFGDKIFVIEDRMSWEKSNYHLDIWFPDYWQALNFGAKIAEVEVLEG